jgi:hypothetical protein
VAEEPRRHEEEARQVIDQSESENDRIHENAMKDSKDNNSQ